MRVTIVALAALAAGSAFAQVNQIVDQTFVRDAARANHAEIELCQLGEQKATTSQVRNLAERMLSDHQKVGDELRSTVGANAQGLMIPPQRSAEEQATWDRLMSLNGTAFDAAWTDVMRREHDKAIALFQDESRRGSDAKLKRFADTTLPSLKMHRQMLDNIHLESR